jgi:hypothetical protein
MPKRAGQSKAEESAETTPSDAELQAISIILPIFDAFENSEDPQNDGAVGRIINYLAARYNVDE